MRACMCWMCECVHRVYICTYVHVSALTYCNRHTYVRMYASTHTVRTYLHICMHSCMYVCVYCMYVCLCTEVCACVLSTYVCVCVFVGSLLQVARREALLLSSLPMCSVQDKPWRPLTAAR